MRDDPKFSAGRLLKFNCPVGLDWSTYSPDGEKALMELYKKPFSMNGQICVSLGAFSGEAVLVRPSITGEDLWVCADFLTPASPLEELAFSYDDSIVIDHRDD